jgi:hypothetical protein
MIIFVRSINTLKWEKFKPFWLDRMDFIVPSRKKEDLGFYFFLLKFSETLFMGTKNLVTA